jgi:hypothetical protein
LIIKKTLFSSIFTTVLCVVIIILFSQDKKWENYCSCPLLSLLV